MLKYRTYAPPSAFGGFAHHDKCFVNELGQRIVFICYKFHLNLTTIEYDIYISLLLNGTT